MIELLQTGEKIALITMFITYFITIIYSVYILLLNRKQAQVKDLVKETNQLLKQIINQDRRRK